MEEELFKRVRDAATTCRPSRIFIAAFLLVAIIFFLRFPDRILEPELRVEDGNIFFMQDMFLGAGALYQAYGGYLHTLQRLVAWIGGWVHPLWTPLIYNGFSLIIMAAVAARIAVASLRPWWRFSFATLYVLQPFCSWQAVNLTNLFWFTAALLPVFAIEEAPCTKSGRALTLALLLLLCLSGPFGVILAPLFLLRLVFIERNRYSIKLLAVVILSGIVQVANYAASNRPIDVMKDGVALGIADFWTLANRFLVCTFFGRWRSEESFLQSGIALALLIVFTAGCISPLLLGRISHRDIVRLGLLLLGAILLYASGIAGSYSPWIENHPLGDGQRYYMLPYLFFVWLVAALASAPSKRWMRLPALAMILAATLPLFHGQVFRSRTWANDIQRVEENGVGILRVMPFGSNRHVFLAKGEGRFGYARGRELGRLLDVNEVITNVFGLHRLWSKSLTAFVYLFPEKVGKKTALLVYPNTYISLKIPRGATGFRGAFGYSRLAIPPNSPDGKAGGDGYRFAAYLVPEEGDFGLLFSKFIEPHPISNRPALIDFSFNIPPGNWQAVLLQNWEGVLPEHATDYDFVTVADLAFDED